MTMSSVLGPPYRPEPLYAVFLTEDNLLSLGIRNDMWSVALLLCRELLLMTR